MGDRFTRVNDFHCVSVIAELQQLVGVSSHLGDRHAPAAGSSPTGAALLSVHSGRDELDTFLSASRHKEDALRD